MSLNVKNIFDRHPMQSLNKILSVVYKFKLTTNPHLFDMPLVKYLI